MVLLGRSVIHQHGETAMTCLFKAKNGHILTISNEWGENPQTLREFVTECRVHRGSAEDPSEVDKALVEIIYDLDLKGPLNLDAKI